MRRYFRLYLYLLKASWSAWIAYRVNFVNSIFATSVWSILIILSMTLLTSRSSHVFGWTKGELWLLAGMYNVVMGIFYFLFAKNLDDIQELIHFGKLDSLLLKPIDNQWVVSFWQVSWRAFIRIIIGFSFLVYLFISKLVLFHWQMLFPFLIFLVLSVSIIYAISFGLMTTVVWISNLSNLRELLSYLYMFTRYPQEMYKGIGIFFSVILFPITIVLVVPTKLLVEKASFPELLYMVLCAVILLFVTRVFWKFALRFYVSASGN